MFSEKQFVFNDDNTGETLKLIIPEIVNPEYGMYVWPCAPVLAQFMWCNRESLSGKRVLELGAGTALPGLVAAKCGAEVHLSDKASFPQCLDNARKACVANGLQDIQIHGITWGEFSGDVLELPDFDLIIASDCFYDSRDFEDIVATVAFLLDRNKCAHFVFAYQERSSSRSIEHLLDKWKLKASPIHPSRFNGHQAQTSNLNHSIQLFCVSPEHLESSWPILASK